jgi:hypothetical protein
MPTDRRYFKLCPSHAILESLTSLYRVRSPSRASPTNVVIAANPGTCGAQNFMPCKRSTLLPMRQSNIDPVYTAFNVALSISLGSRRFFRGISMVFLTHVYHGALWQLSGRVIVPVGRPTTVALIVRPSHSEVRSSTVRCWLADDSAHYCLLCCLRCPIPLDAMECVSSQLLQ